MNGFIYTEDFNKISGTELEDYLIKKALLTPLGSIPFNRGFGSSLNALIGNKENNLACRALIFEAWDNPENGLLGFELLKVSVNKNKVGIVYAKQGNTRDIQYTL